MLTVITHPTPSLPERSVELPVSDIQNADIQSFIDAMIPTMYDDDGIGLAAPQVDRNIRIFVVGKEALKRSDFTLLTGTIPPNEDIAIINPVWEKTTKKTAWEIEGCLSVPKTFGKVRRYVHIHVKGYDRHGHPLVFDASNYLARVIQHETDHLDGILFIDKAKDIYTID